MIAPIDPAIHQQLERAVEQCRVSSGQVEISYSSEVQGEVLFVRSKSLSDEQLQCLAEIEGVGPYPFVLYKDTELTRRAFLLERKQEREDARAALSSQGQLAALPSFDPTSESLADFAKRMEQFCGVEPGSMLMTYLGGLTINPEWAERTLEEARSTAANDQLECVLKSMSASNLEEHGVHFGLIGNEVYSNNKPKE